ncbi:substrate-binding periplasmic protein [Chitinimonas lacunae]|uniref:Substrate-binding periplasmic protein n=1 Tax=Chitinimonas lacunae TaxID=1963018 RepID=A0ABV8MU73_9NEIS
MGYRHGLLTLLLSTTVLGAATTPELPPLRLVIGETKPPYVLAAERRGIEYDLLTAALDSAGYRPLVSFAPNKQAQLQLAAGQADAVISNSGGFLSDPYIAYKNAAISLCRNKLRIHKVPELDRYRVASFHNAQRYLGPEFAAMAARNPDYIERSPQIILNRLLYSGRVDVAISDINIFQHFTAQLDPRLDTRQPLCFHSLFPPTLYRLAFRDQTARDRFNRALRQILRGDFYETLAQRYRLPMENGRPYFKPPEVGASEADKSK